MAPRAWVPAGSLAVLFLAVIDRLAPLRLLTRKAPAFILPENISLYFAIRIRFRFGRFPFVALTVRDRGSDPYRSPEAMYSRSIVAILAAMLLSVATDAR